MKTALLLFLLAAPAASEPPAAVSSPAAQAPAARFTPKAYLKLALARSRDVRRAELAFRQSRDAYLSAVLDAALPAFSFSLSSTLYDDSDPRLRLSRRDVLSSLSASWNLYDSASSPARRLKLARLDRDYAELTFLIAEQNEALKALGRFYSLYAARGRVAAAKANLASREKQYKDTNEQYQSGTRSRIEVMQSEGDKLQSELSLAQAESGETKALMLFNELILAEPETPAELELSTAAVEVKLPLPRGDLARALRDNFGLRRQRLALEKAELTASNAVRAELPRLKLDASWAKTALGVIGEPSYGGAGNPDYGLRASLTFPFGFFGAQNALEIRSRGLALESSRAELENAERALKTEVLTAQNDIALQVRSRDLLEFQVRANTESTGDLFSEYSLGGAGMLQLDTAQTKLLDSVNGRIGAVNALDLGLAGYRALMGERIWE